MCSTLDVYVGARSTNQPRIFTPSLKLLLETNSSLSSTLLTFKPRGERRFSSHSSTTRIMFFHAALLPLLSVLLASVAAHPNFWSAMDAKNRAADDGPTSMCLHPTMGQGSHAGLADDPTISFSLALADLAAITYCPGTTVTATVRDNWDFIHYKHLFLTDLTGTDLQHILKAAYVCCPT